ncbi:16S rRNA (uracil(1498)-N(3))-methyltransferase [Candidatus Ozemobacteraceae bacterium]|nr:16S rRNA (uracil(1498)-N(3))-methyltransferase [Candidatus Ozemobacteraceae bacterium]
MSDQVLVPHARVLEPEADGLLSDENRHYLERVLRLRLGEAFTVTDGVGREAVAVLGEKGAYRLQDWSDPGREPAFETTIFCAVSKGDRFEWLIEKAVEMGVRRIVPLLSSRVVAPAPGPAKIERWRKIAVTAMLQCGGCIIPEIADPLPFKHLPKPDERVLPVLLHEIPMAVSLHELPRAEKPALWIASGPEGGFAPDEVKTFLDAGWRAVWLGKRLFKTDTAPVVALARLLSL